MVYNSPGSESISADLVFASQAAECHTQVALRQGSPHWSCRDLAKALGISKDLVHRVWHEAGLKRHRLEHYMVSNDPDFES